MSGVVCKRLIVIGQVQGVGFRASTLREATRIGGLSGWVRNLAGGEVEIVVQGDPQRVSELVEWAGRGPSAATVERVEESLAHVDPALPAFEIRK